MVSKVKHLYIHIPFCKNICAYCDFTRQLKDDDVVNEYIETIKNQIKKLNTTFKTIYIGGGTPNCLDNEQLSSLLTCVRNVLDEDGEFTVELNPEFVTMTQAKILNVNKVNRVSIGLQTTNNTILKHLGRQHTLKHVIQTITNLQKVGIHNISLDLMYGITGLLPKDILSTIKLIKKYDIKHVSWYALEIKENSTLARNKYVLNQDLSDTHLKLIIKHMRNIRFKRYEVSNWAKSQKYCCLHNLAYWLTKDWVAIGYGGWGLENKVYYKNVGSVWRWQKQNYYYNTHDYYLHILLMGLRLKNGLNLNHKIYQNAYCHFKNKLKFIQIKNNHLSCKNLNLLNETLVNLV